MLWWSTQEQATEKPRSRSQLYCPLMRKKQHRACHTCAFWIPVQVRATVTGEVQQHWNCAHVMSVLVQQDMGQAVSESVAAVHSFRNETVKLIAAAINLFGETKVARSEALTYTVACKSPNCNDPHAPAQSVPIAECPCHKEKAAQLSGAIISGMQIKEAVHARVNNES